LCWEEFVQLFTVSANATLKKRGCTWDLMIDSGNTPTLQQIHLYLTYNREFRGDLHKGLMLQGAIGCGKSLLMESYAHLQNWMIRKFSMRYGVAAFINSLELVNRLKTDDVKMYANRPLIIDEFGREPKQMMHYGNVSTPMIDLLCARADRAVITHGTTNFRLETLASDEYYGAMVGDRLRAMFNFVTLSGESRRR
ncbi:MAG: hypothetical protein SNI45_06410, partial [Rikenellaceae bacterium]